MKSFQRFLNESAITPNHVEYVTRLIFKGKSLDAACKATHRQFNGTVNPFLGGAQDFTVEALKAAYLADKRQTLDKQLARTPVEKHPAAIDAFCSYFKVTPEQMGR